MIIRYTVNDRNSFLSVPWYVTTLTVTSNSCNDNNIGVVDLSSFKFLRSVVIGNGCFQHVQVFSIVGLNWLESVIIGSSSFNADSLLVGSQFVIVNCPLLKSLSISGGSSFFAYDEFELSQLLQLKSVTIGSSNCFKYAGKVVFRGMNDGRDGL